MGNEEGAIELTGKLMVVAIIFVFFILVFLFCLHLYAKWFWYRRQETTTTATTRRRRLDFSAGHQEITLVSALHGGLNPSLLKTIPVIAFNPNDLKDGLLECAVCLCEFYEGEKMRVLPKCNHGFHVECIDMWFQSHSTCPLCRNPVSSRKQQVNSSTESTLEDILEEDPNVESSNAEFYSVETPSFPTNVLFWGDETRVSAFGPCMEENHSSSTSSSSMGNRVDGMLVIDVPRLTNEEEEEKSPIPTGLRSLKRLLISGSGRIKGNSSGSRNMDSEEGSRGQG